MSREMQQALVTLEVVKSQQTLDEYFEVGKVIRVPVEVSETQYIKIVADQRHCPTVFAKWDMLAVCYDFDTKETFGSSFSVTEKEILKWEREMA